LVCFSARLKTVFCAQIFKFSHKPMAKLIRKTYPKEVSIGLLLLVFVIAAFLSHQIFEGRAALLNEGKNTYLGALMVASAVVIMMLVLWEEFLFPVHVKFEGKAVVFSNHRSKLKKQVLIFLLIPVIFAAVYTLYAVNLLGFIIWAGICIISPIAGKLISGLKNYNDFLKLTDETLEYKNNEQEGVYELKHVQQIVLMKDETNILHKIQLVLTNGQSVQIDLDEMEIDAFCVSIDEYFNAHYKDKVKVVGNPV
jgi:hypothetical protein